MHFSQKKCLHCLGESFVTIPLTKRGFNFIQRGSDALFRTTGEFLFTPPHLSPILTIREKKRMMKKGILVLWVFFLCLGAAPGVYSDTITLVADTWCPYNCEPGADLPGFMVEIAETIFKKRGHAIEYKVTPWTRAIQDVRTGKSDGLIGPGKEDAPDFVFPTEKVALMKNVFYGKKGLSWKYTGIDSLKEKTLGVVKGYTYTDEIDGYIKENEKMSQLVQVTSGENVLASNVKKLLAGRIDLILEDANVMQYHLKKNALEKEVVEVGELAADDLYIAFSPSNPLSRSYAEMISEGMILLRKSGELKEILEKYGIRER